MMCIRPGRRLLRLSHLPYPPGSWSNPQGVPLAPPDWYRLYFLRFFAPPFFFPLHGISLTAS